ncbi:hypothetical protein DNU06_03000 [Putridiphycobacter roseus]|uniref:Uncharacterized protein n=1 Tax=Putridiphycobacter roseus TaxID=2219161 RepID=A0A2W1N4S2_9FLAO|nr:hypothetical protein [Putridiphycobacter roseus]PZE18814.1 hypothetical protein DNU06_03000 [Putridiphycobacter roseus]
MSNIVKIYEEISIQSIVYENGDYEAEINCTLKYKNKNIRTKLMISQTDLNRLLAKLNCQGYEFGEDFIESHYLEDGTELIEFNFENKQQHAIHNFQFMNTYTQIGA